MDEVVEGLDVVGVAGGEQGVDGVEDLVGFAGRRGVGVLAGDVVDQPAGGEDAFGRKAGDLRNGLVVLGLAEGGLAQLVFAPSRSSSRP